MKNYYFLLVALFYLPAVAQTTSQSGALKYKVTGKLTGFKQKQIVFEHLTLDKAAVIDSVPYKNDGEFSFSGTASEPGLYRVRTGISLASSVLVIIYDKENNITINSDSIATVKYSYTINGSTASRNVRNILSEAITRYGVMNGLNNMVSSQSQLPDNEKQKIYKKVDSLASANRAFIYNYIDTVRNSVVAIFCTVSFLNPDQDFKQWEKLQERLKKENVTYTLAKEFNDHVETQKNYMKGSSPELSYKIGDQFPDIQLQDTSGKTISLNSLHGQYVLVDFWASWCGPCRAENPNVVQAYKQFHNKGFTVFSISLDTDKKRWEKAIQADKLEWTSHVSELKGWSSSVCGKFGIQSIPNNFLIDKDGKVVGIGLRGEDLIDKLSHFLN